MKPVYQKIEFCNDEKALWGKIESGIYDWLGVKPDQRTFVLGQPKRSGRPRVAGGGTVHEEGDAPQGQHGVRVRVPLGPWRSVRWFQTEQEAKEEFKRRVQELKNEEGPSLYRVIRIAPDEIAEDAYVVTRTPTYG